MEFTDVEVHYLKKLLFNHSLDLLDARMHKQLEKEVVSALAGINKSCMSKLEEYEKSNFIEE